ncbi:MAG: tyrosine phenol-lyase [Pseudohongiellaceae bacterium]
MKTIIEPFRIKSVEPIRMTSREERQELIRAAHYNLFGLAAQDVIIDLLTDSGTGAMSTEQWAAIMRGDESYAGSTSDQALKAAVQEVLEMPQLIPTHQGRAAEHLLIKVIGRPGKVIPNNTHFDTTRANAEDSGALAVDCPCAEAADTTSNFPFKGNIDLLALDRCLTENPGAVPLILVTVTNNAGGGQPVSLENLHGVRSLANCHNVRFFLDACRFAENAYLIQQREEGQANSSLNDIVHEMFSLVDGATFSAKKEGLANIGGFVVCRDAQLATELRQRLVVTEGFPSYGGMAGRDLEAISVGLREVLRQDYQEYRHASIRYVCEALHDRGIPVVMPAGGHAIFLDAARFLPQIPWQQFPGQALAVELSLEGGVRSCEIGRLMLGQRDADTGEELPAEAELVCLAIPRRTYTQSPMDDLVEVLKVLEVLWERREDICGMAITSAPPVLRHFSAALRPLQTPAAAALV